MTKIPIIIYTLHYNNYHATESKICALFLLASTRIMIVYRNSVSNEQAWGQVHVHDNGLKYNFKKYLSTSSSTGFNLYLYLSTSTFKSVLKVLKYKYQCTSPHVCK